MALNPLAGTLPASRSAGWLLIGAALLAVLLLFGRQMLWLVLHARPHGLDVPLLLAQPTVLQVHILTAVASVGVGAVILWARKGRALHRTLGWTWAALMAAAAGTSLFIVGLNGDYWSPIHLLSGWTLALLPVAVWAARRHNVNLHRRTMTGVFWGASITAGAFALLPGRLIWRLFMG